MAFRFFSFCCEDLKAQGIGEVILGTGYMADQVQAFFRRGEEFGLRVCYSREDKPLGTGGALKLAEPLLSDPVVVLNGDSYVEWSLAATRDLFAQKDASVVMILQAVPDVARYGSVTIEPGGRVTEFVEKGTRTGAGLINAGVYLVRKEIVAALPGVRPFRWKEMCSQGCCTARSTGWFRRASSSISASPLIWSAHKRSSLRECARPSADGRCYFAAGANSVRRRRRSILPLSVRGNDFRNSIFSGTI